MFSWSVQKGINPMPVSYPKLTTAATSAAHVIVPKLVKVKKHAKRVRKQLQNRGYAIIEAKSRPDDKWLPQKAIKRLTFRTDFSRLYPRIVR